MVGVNVIFLDFDGVLTSLSCYHQLHTLGLATHDAFGTLFDEVCIAALQKIIDTTGAKIVVTSSWRYIYDIESLRTMWRKRQLPGEIYDLTPAGLAVSPDEAVRGMEIDAWLNSHMASINQYVILDDENQYLSHHRQHLILTDPATGLTSCDADRASQILICG